MIETLAQIGMAGVGVVVLFFLFIVAYMVFSPILNWIFGDKVDEEEEGRRGEALLMNQLRASGKISQKDYDKWAEKHFRKEIEEYKNE